MTLLRIAAGLARSSMPEHRWRRLALPVAALIFMLLLLAATSIVVMVQRQNERHDQRLPRISSAAAPSDVFMRLGGDHWRGERIAVAWIEPATPGGTPVLAPGMRSFPRPGQAAVSPALARLIASEEELARRYPRPLVLGEEGAQTGGELLAYVRPPAGRRIGDEANAVRRSGGRFLGRGPVFRVSGFGARAGPFLTDRVSLTQATHAVLVLLCIPALFVLMVGLSTASRVRDHRFRVLAALGAPRRKARALAALEAGLLAAPALVAAAVVWVVAAPLVRELPLLEYRVVKGDLALPAGHLAAVLLLALALCAAGSIGLDALRRGPAGPRPSAGRGVLSPLALLPLAASLGAFTLAGSMGGDARGRLNVIGITLVVAGTPLALPALLRTAGAWLRESRSAVLSLAGSAMSWDPRRLARPFMAFGALVVIALVAIGYTALMTHTAAEGRSSGGPPSVVSVEWREPRQDDLARLDSELTNDVVLPYRAGGAGHGHGHGHEHGAHQSGLALGGSCPDIAAVVPGISCDGNDPYAVSAAAEAALASVLDIAGPTGSVPAIRLVPRERVAGAGSAFVVADTALPELDERVRTAAMTALPAPFVGSPIDRAPATNPWVRWLGAGAAVAGIALAIACLLSLVDRLLAARQEHRHLMNLGIAPVQMRRLDGALFAVPYGVMSAFALTTGLVIALMMLRSDVPIPWAAIAATVFTTLGLGLVGTRLVSTLGPRRAMREAE